jgi:hypothetical protein
MTGEDIELNLLHQGAEELDAWSFNTEPEDDLSIPECLRRVS